MDDLKDLKDGFVCKICYTFPRPGVQLYYCSNPNDSSCKRVVCQKCCDAENTKKCSICGRWYLTPIPLLTKLSSIFKFQPCIYSKNGCKVEIPADLDNLKAHDESCIYQTVPCPLLNCDEAVMFKDVNDHLTQVHSKASILSPLKLLKNECFRHGDSKLNLSNTRCLNAYNQQFFIQTYSNGNSLHLRILMLGDKIDVIPFKVLMKFFLDDKNEYTVEDYVYPINRGAKSLLFNGEQCTVIPMKKVTEYYDYKTNEYKQQPKFRLNLKIFSPKLDEIAKDEHV